MVIKAVIFDFGGVLMRTVDQNPRRMLAERVGMRLPELYHLVFSSESARLATLGKMSSDAHWETVLEKLDVTEEEKASVIEQFWAGDRLDRSLVAHLRKLRKRIKTGLLSNAWDSLRAMLEAEWKIADAFDEMVISAEVGLAKPDHRIYQMTLDRLQVEASQAVFVDDFEENVDAARWIGMHAIRFMTSRQALAELKAYTNYLEFDQHREG
jgi:epoxide hydrolase-like predicted phosphatase